MSAQPPLYPLLSSIKHQNLDCDLCSDSVYDFRVFRTAQLVCKQLLNVNVAKTMEGLYAAH